MYPQTDLTLAVPMPKNRQNVNYNQILLDLDGYINVNVEVVNGKIKNDRTLAIRNRKCSLIGRDWLVQLHFRVEERQGKREYKNSNTSNIVGTIQKK